MSASRPGVSFSNLPVSASNGNAYGLCSPGGRDNGGNPWAVNLPASIIGDGPGNQPGKVAHCDEPTNEFTVNLTR